MTTGFRPANLLGGSLPVSGNDLRDAARSPPAPHNGPMSRRRTAATDDGHVPPADGTGLPEALEAIATRTARRGGRLADEDVAALRAAGVRAAETGITAGQAVDLYLAATASARAVSLPREEDPDDPDDVLTGVRTAVPALMEGYESAGQQLVRQEETARREFIDDLLRGDADVAGVLQGAEPFGLDLRASHQVLLAEPRDGAAVDERDESALDRAVVARYGDRDVLATTKGGHLVALVPARSSSADVDEPARLLHADLTSATRKPWRVAVGRAHPGAHGVARSYQQAREAIALTGRLHPDVDMVRTRDLLIYRVLGRDRSALADLVEDVLTPLTRARGGAQPLLDTLEAYFACGEVATEAARRLHVSVRTVTYRLSRVTALTGYDPTAPAQKLTLQAAVIGARLLPWPPDGTPDGEVPRPAG